MDRKQLISFGGASASLACLAAILAFASYQANPQSPVIGGLPTDMAPTMPVPRVIERGFRSGAFGPVALYAPAADTKRVVLFLSGNAGWDARSAGLARELANQGIAVAGVSTPAYLARLETSQAACLNPTFDLMALSQSIQHHLGLAAYTRPVLVGHGEGGTLAYVALAQSPAGLWQGVASLGFEGALPGRKPWCHVGSLSSSATIPTSTGWRFVPLTGLAATWRAAPDPQPRARSAATGKPTGRAIPDPHPWTEVVTGLFLPPEQPQAAGVPQDLPLTENVNPQAPPTDRFAIILSGDGGWAGLDRELAANMAARGVPVVGFDSLRYFWTRRTPVEAGRDLSRVIAGYSAAWKRPNVILIGYSFGADVMPAMVAQLPAEARARVREVALMGPSATADFQFHLSDWIGGAETGRPVAPDIAALTPTPVLCIQGEDDSSSICNRLPQGVARIALLPGGHHFGGNAAAVSGAILGSAE